MRYLTVGSIPLTLNFLTAHHTKQLHPESGPRPFCSAPRPPLGSWGAVFQRPRHVVMGVPLKWPRQSDL